MVRWFLLGRISESHFNTSDNAKCKQCHRHNEFRWLPTRSRWHSARRRFRLGQRFLIAFSIRFKAATKHNFNIRQFTKNEEKTNSEQPLAWNEKKFDNNNKTKTHIIFNAFQVILVATLDFCQAPFSAIVSIQKSNLMLNRKRVCATQFIGAFLHISTQYTIHTHKHLIKFKKKRKIVHSYYC